MGMILSFCFLVGFRNQTVHLGGLFSDINGESLPNGPGNNWPKRKIQPVTIPKPKSVFFFERKPKSVADARTARKLKVAVMDPNGVRSVVYCADMVHRSLATLKLFISPSTTGHAYLLSAQVLIKKSDEPKPWTITAGIPSNSTDLRFPLSISSQYLNTRKTKQNCYLSNQSLDLIGNESEGSISTDPADFLKSQVPKPRFLFSPFRLDSCCGWRLVDFWRTCLFVVAQKDRSLRVRGELLLIT